MFTQLLNRLVVPILQAPMAGVQDERLAIATFGETNVSAKSVYGGRDTVQVLSASSISASLRLITQPKSDEEPA